MRNFFQQILRFFIISTGFIRSTISTIINEMRSINSISRLCQVMENPIIAITIFLLLAYVIISFGFIFGGIPDDWTVYNFLKHLISIKFSESSDWIVFHNLIGCSLMIFYFFFSCYKINRILSDDQTNPIDISDFYFITIISIIPLSFIGAFLHFKLFSSDYVIEKSLLSDNMFIMEPELFRTDNKLFFWIVVINGILSISTFAFLFFVQKYRAARLVVFIGMSCVIYLLPLLLNYILITYLYAEEYTKAIWDNYFWLYFFITASLLSFIILYAIYLIIKGLNYINSLNIIALLLSGILILTSVGTIFGFIYYERDRALSDSIVTPGFAKYRQPSVSYYKRILPENDVSEQDKKGERVSDYITLLDAMFYSSYTVTTTGYGMIPLDKWIKFFTVFENLFEFVIVNLVIGVIIGVTNRERE